VDHSEKTMNVAHAMIVSIVGLAILLWLMGEKFGKDLASHRVKYGTLKRRRRGSKKGE
jgi:hypothetical protein